MPSSALRMAFESLSPLRVIFDVPHLCRTGPVYLNNRKCGAHSETSKSRHYATRSHLLLSIWLGHMPKVQLLVREQSCQFLLITAALAVNNFRPSFAPARLPSAKPVTAPTLISSSR